MNRRSFLKRAGALLAISYVNPISLATPAKGGLITGNYLSVPVYKESYCLGRGAVYFTKIPNLEEGINFYARELSDKIDNDISKQIVNGEFKNAT